jgi:hypothetical protein
MKTQEQDLYHGIALMQIVEHESFKALNRATAKYGHYLVNTDREVFVKYRTNNESPWQFTLQNDELQALRKAATKSRNRVFLCLVCGTVTVCALNEDQIRRILDLNDQNPQWVRVAVPPRSSCRVSGSNGELSRTVPHNSFPNKVFE